MAVTAAEHAQPDSADEPELTWEQLRGKIAGLSRDREATDPELVEARRDLVALRLQQHIEKVVSEAPELTPQQVDRIARVLRSAADRQPARVLHRGSGG